MTQPPAFDDKITKEEEHVFLPYNTAALGSNDEIRIPCQAEDLYTLPSKSYLYIEGSITKPTGEATTAKLTNNAIAFMFEEIRLDMNGTTIDRTRNPGIASTMRNYAALNPLESNRLLNAGWCYPGEDLDIVHPANGAFNAIVPLSMFLGFADDHKELILNSKFELVLIRSKNSKNSILAPAGDQNAVVKLTRIEWRMPVIRLSDSEKVEILKIVKADRPLHLAFRTMDLHTQPAVPQTKSFTWNVSTTSKPEKPRFVIVGAQTSRVNDATKDCSEFDHCNITNLRLYLNSECYPYHDMNLDFGNSRFATLYEMYSKFQNSYYEKDNYLLLKRKDFLKHAPIFIIDCSHQPEEVVNGAVNIRIEIQASSNIPAQTSLYCLIIHDKVFTYKPLTHVMQSYF